MVLHTRRVITPVEDISAGTSPATARRRINPVSSRSTPKPLQVSFASPSARRPVHNAGVADKPAPQISPIKAQTDLLESSTSSLQNHLQSPNQIESAHDDFATALVNPSSHPEEPLHESIHLGHEVVEDDAATEDRRESPDRLYAVAESSESGANTKRGSGNSENYYEGQSESDSDQNVGMGMGMDMNEERVGRLRERKPKLNHQELRSMATFAKAQGVDLMKQVEEQKKRRLQEDQEPPDIAKAEMEEMRRILQERRRSSDEYVAPSEADRDSSPERNSRRKRDHSLDSHSRRGSADLQINDQINAIKNEDPSKVLDWLKSADEEKDNRIAVSEDRTLSLLQAIKEGNLGSLGGFEEDWVPLERLREAERRSSLAEEQIRRFEELLNAAEGVDGDEQLRALLSRSKSMERHFHHLKKFAEDRHADLRKLYPVSDKDIAVPWRPHSGASPEKVRKDLQEHENHKKRLVQVSSMYHDLIKFLRVEHSKRVEAESKSQQLTSQIKRQTAALKRAEKVIKHTALSPPRVNESNPFRGVSHSAEVKGSPDFPPFSPSDMQSPIMASYSKQPSAFSFSDLQSRVHSPEDEEGDLVKRFDSVRSDRGMPTLRRINTTGKSNLRAAALPSSTTPSTPMTVTKQLSYDHALEHSLSRNPSPDPGAVLSNSDLIAQNHKKEFEELERALIEEGRSKGFADVDLYSEKKTVGREETCWEYRHVHFDFVRPHQAGSPSASRDQKWDTLDPQAVSNVPLSKRTASPSWSEGAHFEEKHNHTLSTDGGPPHKPLASIPGGRHDQQPISLLKSDVGEHGDDDHQQIERQEDEISTKLIGSAPTEEKALTRTPREGGSEKGTGIEIDKTVKVEEMTRIAGAKDLDRETINKQTKVYRRMLSSPAKIMSSQTENSQLLHREAPQLQTPLALGDITIVEDAVWEDALQDALDNMLVDVGKDELWSEATTKEEEWADMVAEDRVTHPTQAAHKTSSTDTATSSEKEAQPAQQRPSDLQRRMAAVESSHVAQLLRAQVKQRRWLLLFQVVFLAVALLWSVDWWQSVPPPT